MAASTRIYRKHSTGLKLQYPAGGLDHKAARSIPRSIRRRRWRGVRPERFYASADYDSIDYSATKVALVIIKNRQLRQILRAAVCLIIILRQLITGLNLSREQLHHALPQLARLLDSYAVKEFRNQLMRCLPFSARQWAAWNSRKICKASLVNLCRTKHAFQLALSEVAIIKEATTDKAYQHLPLSSIYYQLIRDEKLHCSLSTLYKYCRFLTVTGPKHRHRKTQESLKGATTFSMLHMDITLFKTATV